jgi:Porin subfamily
MTLIKSILLGSAAGIVAAAAAQAADLPTKKAAPAEYVKVCNVGGMAGFLLPGSDTCFKISGYITGQIEAGNVQTGYEWGFAPGLTPGTPQNSPPGTVVTLQKPTATSATTAGFKPGAASVVFGPPNSARDSFGWTARLNVTVDARQDTAYGVLRGYAEMQFDNGNGFDNTGNAGYINRAYVQWAGITAGKANAFFSFYGGGTAWANIFSPDEQGFNQPDVLAYTATFGGGFSATLAIQSSGFVDNGGGTNSFAAGNASFLGTEAPDVVGVLRIDQGWGAAQVSGVAHQVRMSDYYGDSQSTWGWGVLGGVKFNLPSLGAGDDVQLQGVWTRNAVWYSGIPDAMWGENGAVNGNGLPMVVADSWSNGNGTWGTPTAWSIGGFFEHHFSPQFTFGPEAGYAQLHWGGVLGNVIPSNAYSWIVGAAAHWDPVPHLDFEFELLYQSTHQSTPSGLTSNVSYGIAYGPSSFPNNANGFAGRFEITRDF